MLNHDCNGNLNVMKKSPEKFTDYLKTKNFLNYYYLKVKCAFRLLFLMIIFSSMPIEVNGLKVNII